MLNFETMLIPPPLGQENPKPEWTAAKVVRETIENDLEAERIIRQGIADDQHILVAYSDEKILGFQYLYYDPIEIQVGLGKSAVSSTLTESEKTFLEKQLAREAHNYYEAF